MNFVYVLSSNKTDYYYEQFLLSIVSLQLYNKNFNIIVLVDKKTKKNLNEKRNEYEKYVTEIKVVETPVSLPQKEASRFIKTSMRQHITGDFLFIDCDTIITGKLIFTSPVETNMAAVLDSHIPLSQHHLYSQFRERDKILGYTRKNEIDKHFNSGIIYSRDTPDSYQFFEKWHSLWIESNKKGISADQPSFNQANYECNSIITELDGSWNCQISHNGLPFLFNAKIIHYFATSLVSFEPPFMLASKKILESIKENGIISSDIMKLLHNPKTAFSGKTRLIADQVIFDILESAFFSKLLWLRRKHQKLFNKLNTILNNIKKPGFSKKVFSA
ncbi:MAG: hypothetical protein LBE13_05855 [Bacteroidales bacterium]|jgi:hypothetical protein|nr:hypothetical protein [Bacteroidales bacterium]